MMTIASAMFDTPKLVYQRANINHIASQGKGSLLDGGELVKLDTLTNTVTSSYGITDNQSDKLSSGRSALTLTSGYTQKTSGHSANILAQHSAKLFAQSLAKVSAGQSAKFYAGLSGETLSYPNPDIPNRGEITPFVEFSESIKKGSVSTTLCVFDIKYRANQLLQSSQWLKPGKQNISGEAKNFDDNHLFLSSDVRYSDRAPAKSGVRIGVLNNTLATHDAPSVFFCVRAHAHLLNAVSYRAYSMVAAAEQPQGWLVSFVSSNANSVVVTTPEIGVSGGDSLDYTKEIIVMMAIPAQTQFKFLFLAVKRADSTDIPHRIEATAPNEHSARLLLVRDYILSFAGRLPVREVAA